MVREFGEHGWVASELAAERGGVFKKWVGLAICTRVECMYVWIVPLMAAGEGPGSLRMCCIEMKMICCVWNPTAPCSCQALICPFIPRKARVDAHISNTARTRRVSEPLFPSFLPRSPPLFPTNPTQFSSSVYLVHHQPPIPISIPKLRVRVGI